MSEWITVYEDQVYKGNDVTSKVGMFNWIDVRDTAIVIPLFKAHRYLSRITGMVCVQIFWNYQADLLMKVKSP
jgi:hypothetical protein